MDEAVNLTFASLNIVGALLIAVLMMETTPEASIKRAWIDPQAMWGMLRRLFYISIAGGMAGMSLGVYGRWFELSYPEMAFWLMITVPIALFQLIRAFRLIDQDRWVGWHGNVGRRNRANAHAINEQEKPFNTR